MHTVIIEFSKLFISRLLLLLFWLHLGLKIKMLIFLVSLYIANEANMLFINLILMRFTAVIILSYGPKMFSIFRQYKGAVGLRSRPKL